MRVDAWTAVALAFAALASAGGCLMTALPFGLPLAAAADGATGDVIGMVAAMATVFAVPGALVGLTGLAVGLAVGWGRLRSRVVHGGLADELGPEAR